MLETLQFVKGAVAKKDFVPALGHFHIANGRITSYNGILTLSSPIALDIEAAPKAIPFIKAIQTCKDTVVMHLTPANRLSIKSGGFKAFVECDEITAFPDTKPEGYDIETRGELLPALKKLLPFIAEDASRPWARGILFRGQSCFATNNIIIMEYWLGVTNFPGDANLPIDAVKELVRIGKEPTRVQVMERSMTFHFDDGRWLKTQLFSAEWPPLEDVLEREYQINDLPYDFFDSVQELLPFVREDFGIYLEANKLFTCRQEGEGASVEVDNLDGAGLFNIKQLLLLKGQVHTIDFHAWPRPCLLFGEGIRGAIIGMKDIGDMRG